MVILAQATFPLLVEGAPYCYYGRLLCPYGHEGDPMATISTTQKSIHYLETDGKPMAETDMHHDVLIYLREAL
jgi:hypothetical protein